MRWGLSLVAFEKQISGPASRVKSYLFMGLPGAAEVSEHQQG